MSSASGSKRPIFLAGCQQVGWFECGRYEKELFEGHPKLAKAALTEDERVKFQHFVADHQRQCARCNRFGKVVLFISENRANHSDRRFGRRFDRLKGCLGRFLPYKRFGLN
jgi:hypothetical protein